MSSQKLTARQPAVVLAEDQFGVALLVPFGRFGTPLVLLVDGALAGRGTPADPLRVQVDGTTIVINANNQLEAIGSGPGPGTPTVDFHLVAATGLNATSVVSGAATLYGTHVYNNAGYPVFVKIYNTAGAPVVGTDVPVRTVSVQAGERADDLLTQGMGLSLGLGIAIVKGIADLDTTPVGAADCVLDLDYTT